MASYNHIPSCSRRLVTASENLVSARSLDFRVAGDWKKLQVWEFSVNCSSMKVMTMKAAGREAWPGRRPEAQCSRPSLFSEQRGAHAGRGGRSVGRGQQPCAHLCGDMGRCGHVWSWARAVTHARGRVRGCACAPTRNNGACVRMVCALGLCQRLETKAQAYSVSEGFGVFVFVCQHLKLRRASHQD